MSLDTKTRELLLLALGSPRETNPQCALEIALDALHSETRVLSDADTSSVASAHLLAIVCRLEALREFVTECLSVRWAAKPEAAQ